MKSIDSYYLSGSALLLAMRISSVAMGLGTSVLLARVLGPNEFGIFAFIVVVATVLALPLTGGLPQLLVREISAANATRTPEIVSGIISWAYKNLFIISFAVITLALSVHALGSVSSLWHWDHPNALIALLCVALILPLSYLQVARGILAGQQRVILGATGEQLIRPGMVLAAMLVAIWLIPLDAGGALWIYLGGAVAAAIIVSIVVSRVRSVRTKTKVIHNREWWLALIPLTAISGIAVLKNNTDIIMLGIMKTPADVADYRIAAQIAVMSSFVMQIMRSLSAPRISSAHAAEDGEKLQQTLVLTGRAMFLAAFAFTTLFALFGAYGIKLLFGAEYSGAFYPCLILCFGFLLSSACGLVGVFLQMSRNARIAARAAAIATVLNVLFNLILVPEYSAVGAAIATTISLTVMQLQQWWYAYRTLGVRTDVLQILKPRMATSANE